MFSEKWVKLALLWLFPIWFLFGLPEELSSLLMSSSHVFHQPWIYDFFSQKDQIILAPVWGILADFWVPHEIKSYNFQNLLVFALPEPSQNLMSFRQLLFSLIQREKSKKIQKPKNLPKLPQTGAKMIWSFYVSFFWGLQSVFFWYDGIF